MTAKQAQHLLAYLGFYALEIDGLWGPGSREAMGAFRRVWGLPAGEQTDAEAEEALKRAVFEGLPREDFWEEIEFFTREEFKCKCGLTHAPYCGGFPAEPKEALVRIADAVRRELGRPMVVVSGLRCREHNRDSGGVANSQHMFGEAMDVTVPGLPAETLLAAIRSRPGVRYAYAINETNVHFDIPGGG